MSNKSLSSNLIKGITQKLNSVFRNPYREVNVNWFKLKYYKHLPTGILRKHRLFGKYIYFYSPTEFLHGLKEIFIDKIYFQQLEKQPYIIDCGANIGLSVIYMKELYPSASIIAFEPDDKNFDLLEKNISSFGYADIELRKEAVWIENTEISFKNDASMSSKIEEADSSSSNKVKAIRLKDYLNKKVDFLKIDIEGAEFKVLCDIEEKLGMVENLFIEYHGLYEQTTELTKMFSILSANGFHYYIKEAAVIFPYPFVKEKNPVIPYDVQLNIFCYRN